MAYEKNLLFALHDLMKDVKVKRCDFIVSVNDERTGMRVVTVPPMPRGELAEAIKMEAKNYFPFPIDEGLLDFEILGEILEEGMKKKRVAVATSPRKTVERYLAVLKKAGIKPLSLIPVPYALYKLGQGFDSQEGKTRCLVDIGLYHTECVIFKGRDLIFSRKIPVAGADFTKALTGVLVSDRGKTQLSAEEAEKVKMDVGIPAENESRIIGDKISITQVLSLMRSPVEQLVGEMDRCFNYYREETGGGAIDQVILSGQGASLKGLSQSLAEGLGMEIHLADSFGKLKFSAETLRPAQELHSFAVAFGAALSAGEGMNLLPPEFKEETKRTFARAGIQSACAAAVLLIVFLYIGMKIQLSNLDQRIAVARSELSSLQVLLGQAEEQSIAKGILAGEPYWEDVFRELSHLAAEGLYLAELSMKERVITLKGRIVAREREGILSSFIQRLEQGIFRNVRLVTAMETSDKSATEFELECWVD